MDNFMWRKIDSLPPPVRQELDEFISSHVPLMPTREPVEVPRNIFDLMCMFCLATLQKLDDDRKNARNN